jgi:hypothetical protein
VADSQLMEVYEIEVAKIVLAVRPKPKPVEE